MEIEKGNLNLREGGTFGKVVVVDRVTNTIDVLKQKIHIDYHPETVFAYTHIGCKAQEAALFGIGQRVADDGGVSVGNETHDRAGRGLLLSLAPRLSTEALCKPEGEIVAHLARTVLALDHSVLPVQGPPGAGKTYAGAEAICRSW